MKKSVILLFAIFAFAANVSAQEKGIDFNHCNDDKFSVVSLNQETGILTLVIQAMNPPSSEELAVYKRARLNWFFEPKTGFGIVRHGYDIAGINLVWFDGKDGLPIEGDASVHLEILSMSSSENVILLSFKLNHDQIELLSMLNGLPDTSMHGFEFGNLHLEQPPEKKLANR